MQPTKATQERLSLADIASGARRAAEALRVIAPVTPLLESGALSKQFGCRVLLKCDQMLPTGSFKLRGAFNKLLNLSQPERACGVVTASTGNHGLALATVAARAGVRVHVHASASASPAKLEAIRSLGAAITLHAADPLSVELLARREAEASGAVFVSPYNDVDVVAGQGGCAVEILDAEPEVDAVIVSVGGGGLLAGVGSVMRTKSPQTEVFGVWPENAQSLLCSIRAGRAVAFEETPTLSDGTAGGVEPDSITIELGRKIAPAPLLVSEDEIIAALRQAAISERFVLEGAAGVALAGLAQAARCVRGGTIVVVLCGRNIQLEKFLRVTRLEQG